MADKAKQLKIEDIEPSKDSVKEKALADALKSIEKTYGKGSIMKLGDANLEKVEVIPTGSITLDIALGVGGYPKGRIIEIYGPESSGKTTFALHAIAEAQKKGGYAAFIDAEHALDPVYAKALGVDTDNLILSQPDNGEQALEIVEALVRSNAVDIIVIDSVAALVPKAEIEGDMGDSHVGLQARLMSQAMRKLAGIINKSKTVAIFINQIREKVGVLFGSPETIDNGLVLQDTWIFRGTVRENIAYAKPEATLEEVIEAAKLAHAHSFIKRLPNGYDTVISATSGLSQGEKQLITIARLMMTVPDVVILDEATSSIDTLTEQKIVEAFNYIMDGRTSFVIAHRLSTIQGADLIIVMNKGNIVEVGNHQELIKKNGFYTKLYNQGIVDN